jgi:hypothetical protein
MELYFTSGRMRLRPAEIRLAAPFEPSEAGLYVLFTFLPVSTGHASASTQTEGPKKGQLKLKDTQEGSMNKKLAVLSISALVVALAVPMLAQSSMRLKANIPFEFVVSGKTLPAGEYSIDTASSQVVVRSIAQSAGAIAIGNNVDVKGTDPTAATKLVFNRYGDKYFLSEVLDGWVSSGLKLPVSHTERELATSASTSTPETLTVLASLR